ncbi:MAG: hypothetical protein ACRC68_02030 [Clostridium sp.]
MRYGRRHRKKLKYRMPRFVGETLINNGNFSRNKMNLLNKRYCSNKIKIPRGIITIVGYIIVITGVLLVMKNTMIYSGSGGGIVTGGGIIAGGGRSITIGTPCGLEFVILIVGIVFVLYKANSFIGWSLISIGTLWFLISVIMNFRMVFMPMNMLKTLIIFAFIAFGISMILKGRFNSRR